ncbi:MULTISPECIES: polysialyltransferase family glycosyltransferase [unclassified Vibrio]|uniref:polysialyltransferase family glycosyltransferase n=1 Tax=unclassified Vibrio TaxID=2614977 RepID=UPI000C832D7D|nr:MULTISPECIES: polysialyltransferase family glycosyltransferase [unclassified Vibrio]PMI22939.1 capsular biosynthesis protein CpsK [Vibrio sp. 10N.286.46.E10]PTP07084.1 capsular biosynthesis protein CpsK [Vibrio sp. 10N.286.45.A3]PTQ24517.1 capsular biosynthesis protein CpsK [Vibrio sp. 10N.286.46.E10]TKE88457.1 capsular biosynthesis protein CpsK [Vibrio sp. F12]TKE93575.1 capsular biosynthesis protein CpsK [Vibrio sp. F12]
MADDISNLYMCSTVRHVMLSVFHAVESNKNSTIVLFNDYQSIPSTLINTSNLPSNIKIVLASRDELTSVIKQKGLIGKFILKSSILGFRIPDFLKRTLISYINAYEEKIFLDLVSYELFVFNDDNKMSRLFRLLVPNYKMIEDGMRNYIEIPIHSPIKKIFRKLKGYHSKTMIMGEKNECLEIHLLSPDKSPSQIHSKVQKLNISQSTYATDLLSKIFQVDSYTHEKRTIILATQPTSKENNLRFKDINFVKKVYQNIYKQAVNAGYNVVLKLHPSEPKDDYNKFFEGVEQLPPKLPVELFLMLSDKKIGIVSLFSSVGMGLEEYCDVFQILKQEEIAETIDTIVSFEKNPAELDLRIKQVLQKFEL